MRSVVLSGVALLFGASVLPAQGWIVPRPCFRVMPIESPAPRPTYVMPGGSEPHVMRAEPVRDCGPHIERTRSDVHVSLDGNVLHYEVDERFVNRGAGLGEADYVFPLPDGAAFQDLQLSVNGELVTGETMDAGRAREIYESIVRMRRDPALVEWMGHGLLRARIFPLNPGEEKRVVVRFQSVAQREGDAVRVDYFRGAPTDVATGPEIRQQSDEGSSSFTLTYPDNPRFGTAYSPTNELDAHSSNGARDVSVHGDARDVTVLVPVRRATAAAISVLPYAPGNENGFALITVTPPAVSQRETTPRDVTLVLDVSGSMQGHKIEQARAAARQLLGTLRPADRFRLIDFSSDVRTFKDDFVNASADNVREASRYIDDLRAEGGTNIEGALREVARSHVAEGRLPLVLFITDGEPTIGDANPDHLAAIARDASGHGSADAGRRIFTFGLGSDVNVSLLEQLAMDGRGTAQFVRPNESVERMVGIVADRLVDPVLTDVRVHVEGDGVRLSSMLPSQPSDMFADRDLVLVARYTGHGAARVVVDGTRRGKSVEWTTAVQLPERDRSDAFVARLWATQRVGFLTAQRHKDGPSTEVDDEIRTLGERYGIPTELTSYLVREPAFVSNQLGVRRGMATSVNGVPAAAPASAGMAPSRDLRFESARTAAVQRQTTNVAAVDSMTVAMKTASGVAIEPSKNIGGHAMTLRDSVWTDAAYHQSMHLVVIKPYSAAYFSVLERLPELRAVFTLGDRLIVAGHGRAIELSDRGVSEIGAADLAKLARDW
jgi:Ca-activated chloride channel family protein